MIKRSIAVFLVVLMLTVSLVSCKSDGSTDSGEVSNNVSTNDGEETGKNYNIGDAVGNRDYGKNITIAHCEHVEFAREIAPKSLTGDRISDSLYKRDKTVEERLNVTLKHETITGGVKSVVTALRADAQSGTCSFDLTYSPLYLSCGLNTEGMYYDLNKMEDIDFDKPYWGKYVNDNIEIGNIQYNATGALCLNFYRFVFATVVNSRILSEQSDAPNLFEVVESGEWTLEYQTQLARKYYQDRGVAGKDQTDDVIGFFGTPYGLANDPYFSSCDVSFLKKDSMGYLSVNLDMNKMSDAVDAIIKLLTSEGAVLEEKGSLPNAAVLFTKGDVLMTTLRFAEIVNTLNVMDDPYMILPVPKLNTEGEYKSFLHDEGTVVSVPITVAEEDVQMLGAVMEVLASEGYRYMVPEYYETVLKMRYTSAPENWDILDNIMENVVMDPSAPYEAALKADGRSVINKWRTLIQDCVENSTNTTASTFNSSYLIQLRTLLNGKDGLNTIYREIASGE